MRKFIYLLLILIGLISCAASYKNSIDTTTTNQQSQNNVIQEKQQFINTDTTEQTKNELTEILLANSSVSNSSSSINPTNNNHIYDSNISSKNKQENNIIPNTNLIKNYRIQVGAFSSIEKVDEYKYKISKLLSSKGSYQTFVVSDKNLYKLQIGEFKNKEEAENILNYLKQQGINGFIIYPK